MVKYFYDEKNSKNNKMGKFIHFWPKIKLPDYHTNKITEIDWGNNTANHLHMASLDLISGTTDGALNPP